MLTIIFLILVIIFGGIASDLIRDFIDCSSYCSKNKNKHKK